MLVLPGVFFLVGLWVGLDLLIFVGETAGLLLGFFVGFLVFVGFLLTETGLEVDGFLLLGLEFAGFLLTETGLEFDGFLLLGLEPVLPLFLPHCGHERFFLLFFDLVRFVVFFPPNLVL